jgi:hypothetical protein
MEIVFVLFVVPKDLMRVSIELQRPEKIGVPREKSYEIILDG